MNENKNKKKNRFRLIVFLFLGGLFVFLFNQALFITSTNEFCESCHVHPQATQTWKFGKHFDTASGFVTNCSDCHLPPGGWDYFQAKVVTGLRDVYGVLVKDESDMNWELKSTRQAAENHVYKASCLHCHQNLFPRTLTKKGEDAHLYYDQNNEKLRCINCHLQTGHFHKKQAVAEVSILEKEDIRINYSSPVFPDTFESFTETIPGTKISFDMVAITGGEFIFGSPEDESYRRKDEGPQNNVKISSFWMGRIEVSWDEYDVFYKETGAGSHNESKMIASKENNLVDAVTGPTPAYGNPDQGWGRGQKPAITMTHFAAKTYCEWLSEKTGKTYRMPTEAEWEYACRAGGKGAYYFEGEPEQFAEDRLTNMLFGLDTTINKYVVYISNSAGTTHLPNKQENAFGLINMLGNVKEFCSDYYREDTYTLLTENENSENPTGPETGNEYVIRGGSYKSTVQDVRTAARGSTKTEAWLITDPQIPKSRWWYSDCNDVGFRVVCEYSENK